MDYKVIQGSSLKNLEAAVKEHIVQGWQPLGGIAIAQQLCDATKHVNSNHSTLYSAGFMFAQAMIQLDGSEGR